MDSILSLLLGVQIKRNEHGLIPFPLDECIIGATTLFENRAYDAVICTFLNRVDEDICSKLIGKFTDPSGMLQNLKMDPCCKNLIFEKSRMHSRKIMTSLCKLEIHAVRVRCIGCGKSFVPLTKFLGLRPRQNKSNELLQKVIEMAVDQTYRRGLSQLQSLTGINMSLGQMWRTVIQSEFFNLNSINGSNPDNFQLVMDQEIKAMIVKDPLHAILADGTGYKLQREPINIDAEIKKQKESDSKFIEKSRPLQSEVRIIFGITKRKVLIPMGVYTDKESWKTIGKDLYKRFGKNEKLKPEPIADVLIADGEEALFRGLRKLAKKEQRCQWHFTHEFKGVFQYQDEGKKEDRKNYQSEIQTTMDQIHETVTATDTKDLTEQKKLELEAEIINAELTMEKLADKLKEQSHFKSEGYVRNATYKLFTYLRYYLKTGILGSKVTSQLERFMREVGRRIKKIAWNWSAKGVAALCYIILVRAMNRSLWGNYWKRILGVTGNFKMTFDNVFLKNQEPSLLH